MPTDRIFRFSISGIMFLLSFAFCYYLFGLELPDMCKENNSDYVLAVVGIFVSSPIVGIFISTITLWICFLFVGYRIYYFVPTDITVINYLIEGAKVFEKRLIKRGLPRTKWFSIRRWRVKREKTRCLYPYYQAKVKTCIDGEALQFLERRWSTYWTHLNNVFATGYALIIAGVIKYCSTHTPSELPLYKALGLVLLALYTLTAITNLLHSRGDAVKFEHILLEESIKKNIEKEKKRIRKEARSNE